MTDDNSLVQKAQNADGFYSDDVQANALAENKIDPDVLVVDDEPPVTTGELELGDMDAGDSIVQNDDLSYDEEAVAGGEDVNGEDDDD